MTKPYKVICADPPWSFSNRLPLERLMAFPLPPLADDALLFLWRVSSQVEEAYQVVRAWGFTAKTEIVWRKRTANGERWLGTGRIVRAEHATCLVAQRGRPRVKAHDVRSTFDAPAGAHSAKPECFYHVVEALSDGPYVELFARRPRPGWACLGDQL